MTWSVVYLDEDGREWFYCDDTLDGYIGVQGSIECFVIGLKRAEYIHV